MAIVIGAKVVAVVTRRVAVVPAMAVDGGSFDASTFIIAGAGGTLDRSRVFLVERMRRECAGAGISRALVHVIILGDGCREVLKAPASVAVAATGAAAPIAIGIGWHVGVGRHIAATPPARHRRRGAPGHQADGRDHPCQSLTHYSLLLGLFSWL